MIGGLQGEFGDLDIKYLKQNISKSRSEISGSFRRNSVALCKMETWSSVLSEFTFWLWAEMDPASRECLTSQAVRGIWIDGCGCSPGKRYQKIQICLTREVETSSSPIRLWDIRRRWNELCRTSLSRATPSRFPKRTRGALPYPDSLKEKHTTLAIITPGRWHILSGYVRIID